MKNKYIHSHKAEYDLERTRFLEDRGFRVIRFWNTDVDSNIDKVLIFIKNQYK